MSHRALDPRAFRPAWWLRNPHAQTFAGRYLRPRATVPLERCRIGTPDGDFLNLDYAPEPSPGAPLVVLLHGLEGSTRRGYMSEMLRQLFVRGLRGVGMNFRGCGGEPNRVARFYHSAETGDLAHVVSELRSRHPGRPIGAAGFSPPRGHPVPDASRAVPRRPLRARRRDPRGRGRRQPAHHAGVHRPGRPSRVRGRDLPVASALPGRTAGRAVSGGAVVVSITRGGGADAATMSTAHDTMETGDYIGIPL